MQLNESESNNSKGKARARLRAVRRNLWIQLIIILKAFWFTSWDATHTVPIVIKRHGRLRLTEITAMTILL